MTLRRDGQRRVAGALIDGAELLGDVTQQSGQLLLADGSSAEPSVAFATDPDVGISRTGGGAIAINHSAAAMVTITASAVSAFQNRITGGEFWTPEATKTANYTATTTDAVIPVDTTGGAVQVDLVASPAFSGAVVVIADVGGNAGSANITIARNGNTIDGAASDKTIATNYGAVVLLWTGATWKTIAEV